jgi:hypothetical protein
MRWHLKTFVLYLEQQTFSLDQVGVLLSLKAGEVQGAQLSHHRSRVQVRFPQANGRFEEE